MEGLQAGRSPEPAVFLLCPLHVCMSECVIKIERKNHREKRRCVSGCRQMETEDCGTGFSTFPFFFPAPLKFITPAVALVERYERVSLLSSNCSCSRNQQPIAARATDLIRRISKSFGASSFSYFISNLENLTSISADVMRNIRVRESVSQ